MAKVFFSYQQQIEKLVKEKDLLIADEEYAKEMLKRYSYYSLISGYKDIFKNTTTKTYKKGTRFEDIVNLSLIHIYQIFADKEKKHITFHGTPLDEDTKDLATYKYKFICGTNVLSPNVEWFCPFHTTQNLEQYNDICLLGVGSVSYTHLDVYKRQIEENAIYERIKWCIENPQAMKEVSERLGKINIASDNKIAMIFK